MPDSVAVLVVDRNPKDGWVVVARPQPPEAIQYHLSSQSWDVGVTNVGVVVRVNCKSEACCAQIIHNIGSCGNVSDRVVISMTIP